MPDQRCLWSTKYRDLLLSGDRYHHKLRRPPSGAERRANGWYEFRFPPGLKHPWRCLYPTGIGGAERNACPNCTIPTAPGKSEGSSGERVIVPTRTRRSKRRLGNRERWGCRAEFHALRSVQSAAFAGRDTEGGADGTLLLSASAHSEMHQGVLPLSGPHRGVSRARRSNSRNLAGSRFSSSPIRRGASAAVSPSI